VLDGLDGLVLAGGADIGRRLTKSHHQAVDVQGDGLVASGWSVLDELVGGRVS
jgi:hypothetical protein